MQESHNRLLVTDLIVLWRKVGDQRSAVVTIAAVHMAQHDSLIKGLCCCDFIVMAAQM